jgi:hypothetical protein
MAANNLATAIPRFAKKAYKMALAGELALAIFLLPEYPGANLTW